MRDFQVIWSTFKIIVKGTFICSFHVDESLLLTLIVGLLLINQWVKSCSYLFFLVGDVLLRGANYSIYAKPCDVEQRTGAICC